MSDEAKTYMPEKYCTETQYYKGIPLCLVVYDEEHFAAIKTKRFTLGDPKYKQSVWIPNSCLDETARILPNANLDQIMQDAYKHDKLRRAGIVLDLHTWRPKKKNARRPKSQPKPQPERVFHDYHTETQYYKGVQLTLVPPVENCNMRKAKKFLLGEIEYNQTVKIPNEFLDDECRILPDADLGPIMQAACLDGKFYRADIPINPFTWKPARVEKLDPMLFGTRMREKYCTETQYYKGIPLKLIVYTEGHFARLDAKRFMLGDLKYNQNLWIPNAYLDETGRIQPWADLDWKMQQEYRKKKFFYARIPINPYTWEQDVIM